MSRVQNKQNLDVYRSAMEVAEKIWEECNRFSYRSFKTVGCQLTRAADSIGANISEGFGRYTYREKIRFCHIARGSLEETTTWLEKALRRGFVDQSSYDLLCTDLVNLHKAINGYIRYLRSLMATKDKVE
ncbi:MAG: four helix bundle protein [Rhodothermales bacterium]|nr:four helix bundle protein [Rhodothermales bacterium]